jgi:uncharacterized protein (DUF2252 family)
MTTPRKRSTSDANTPAWKRQGLSVEERVARGKAARDAAPRSSHGSWSPAQDRPEAVALLEEQARGRLPELLPIRYGRMLVSPFTFFRGGALVMASDLAPTPRSGVQVQLCGDAHLSNFGLFASPERQLMFDINDFDETLPGPWEWDVKRLAASLEIAGRDRGFAAANRREVVLAAAREYREHLRAAAGMRTLDAWYSHLNVDELTGRLQAEVRNKRIAKKDAKIATQDIAKARTRDSVRVFAKRAGQVDGELRIVADPPLIVPVEDLDVSEPSRRQTEQAIARIIRSYRRTLGREHHPIEEFRYVHMARKVVGIGSVGTRCWIVLLIGRDESDPLFLQAKEASPSVLARFLAPSQYRHEGQRVVAGQHLMQAATDIFLGWQRVSDQDGRPRDFYVRQFQDWKGSVQVESLKVPGATLYGRLCATALARAHARWGDRVAIATYLGRGDQFDRAIADFAVRYADQNERDYEALAHAVRSGRIAAEKGI